MNYNYCPNLRLHMALPTLAKLVNSSIVPIPYLLSNSLCFAQCQETFVSTFLSIFKTQKIDLNF